MVEGDVGRVSWELALTADFLPTIMDVLNVSRPAHQSDWGMDGRSMLPLLKAPVSALDRQDRGVYADGKNVMPPQPMGWMYVIVTSESVWGVGFVTISYNVS